MKNFIFLMTLLTIVSSCQNEVRYASKSAEIDTVKQHIKNYNDQNYDLSLLADNSMSFYNTKTDSLSKSEVMAYHKANDENYASRGFLEEDQFYEMVVTDDGETWVNAWLDWSGTLKGSSKTIVMPVHLTYKFEDGKIVRELGYWDPTEISDEIENLTGATAASSTGNSGGSIASGDTSSKRLEVTEVSSIEEMPSSAMSSSSKASANSLSSVIASRLRNPGFPVNDDSKASIKLTVNSSNQIVVLGVESADEDIQNFIIDRLNYHQLDFDFENQLKVYTVPVTIISD
jgi:hypothetical protein